MARRTSHHKTPKLGRRVENSGERWVVAVVTETNRIFLAQTVLGLNTFAAARGWAVHLFQNEAALRQASLSPDVIITGMGGKSFATELRERVPVVSFRNDLTAWSIPSVVIDDRAVGRLAAEHLLALPVRSIAVFMLPNHPFAEERATGFEQLVRQRGDPRYAGRFEFQAVPGGADSDAKAIRWLSSLPRPAGVFTCCDGWSYPLYRFIGSAGLQVPHEIAVIGAGDEQLECMLARPRLTSVVIPWAQVGATAARLAMKTVNGTALCDHPECVQPATVAARESTDFRGATDPLVSESLAFLRANAQRPIGVQDVAQHTRCARRTLERAFRNCLGRSVLEEIHCARVEHAKYLLATTTLGILEIAAHSGFGHPHSLNRAMLRIAGMTPAQYRALR